MEEQLHQTPEYCIVKSRRKGVKKVKKKKKEKEEKEEKKIEEEEEEKREREELLRCKNCSLHVGCIILLRKKIELLYITFRPISIHIYS